ncbi:uncharacterized protein DUF1214 [Novosphingobium sp. PhB55]|uniref:DUF1254 domain-containing protein n=1 Tax=Novosphingobium sp. PhB55 TaxID=2485106 RepID=UPI00106649C0|nr:DUF1254 domain-containing protein [Novosphingobium sp. PhB55]TDW59977.1 uncharacterized protein DUF1214 [Novosphingobium sp. PhB55]
MADSVTVTVDTFVRAESDMYFGQTVAKVGIGQWHHARDLMPLDHQVVIRGNRDTVYSSGVFDLDAGPVTITLPDAGARYMSMQIFDEDQYTKPTIYDPGSYTLDRANFDTRYVLVGIRTLVNPRPGDLNEVHTLQDAITIEQPGGPGSWEVPAWDIESKKKVRDALLVLAGTVTDTSKAFGSKAEVDPVQRLLGAASAWGANSPRDALYFNFVPASNDGETVYTLMVPADVPVDGFWSVSVYGEDGYYHPNASDRYTLNNLTAVKDSEGGVTIQFGGCDPANPNCLPIERGWNYMVRLYRPHDDVLNGNWAFPEARLA